MGMIVQLNDYREPEPKRVRVQPFHKKYPMPFFKPRKGGGINAWNVMPTGDYRADCERESKYAIEFLKSCDKTYGWEALLPAIIADMIRAGTNGRLANGFPKINGVVIGFMNVIGAAVAHSRVRDDL
jgi:hypothetical protein